MISFDQYFGPWLTHKDATDERQANAVRLLSAVGMLERLALLDGVEFPDNPATGSGVSGSTYGGFRPQDCPQGAKHSSHKEGLAVDRYDPHGDIDKWCMMNSGIGGKLEQCGIYIEHPKKTDKWSHWTVRVPGSGKRVFWP
jgi:hypothetical protein